MTLDQLRVLEAIARTGSFARAAETLHRVPSAVSYAVKQLEESLELELFDRSRRTAVLTPAGERILEAACGVLEGAGSLEQLARELAGGWEPELRVVVDGALPLRPFLAAMAALQDPEVPTRVRLDVEYREGVPHRFETEDAHLMAVIGFDPGEDIQGLALDPLPELELVLVASRNHPVLSDPTAVAHHPELAVRDSAPGRPRGRSVLDSRHLITLSDFHAKRLALLDGVGFGWIPHHLVAADLVRGDLALLDLPDREPRFTYRPQLVHRADRPPGKAQTRFVAALEQAVASRIEISD